MSVIGKTADYSIPDHVPTSSEYVPTVPVAPGESITTEPGTAEPVQAGIIDTINTEVSPILRFGLLAGLIGLAVFSKSPAKKSAKGAW
jgi:hypothetical protein